MSDIKFSRVYLEDPRDNLFPISAIIPPNIPKVNAKDWWDGGWQGNQLNTHQCVAFSWAHWIEDGPLVHHNLPTPRNVPMLAPNKFYEECQKRDGLPGTNYNGTTVRAGAKVLKELGLISEYRWTRNVNEMIDCLTFLGPLVVGSQWYGNMTNLRRDNICRLGGSPFGGHAYVVNAFNRDKKLFRIKNSWGNRWGMNGSAFISFEDMQTLLSDRGEACMAVPKRVDRIPTLESLSPPIDKFN